MSAATNRFSSRLIHRWAIAPSACISNESKLRRQEAITKTAETDLKRRAVLVANVMWRTNTKVINSKRPLQAYGLLSILIPEFPCLNYMHDVKWRSCHTTLQSKYTWRWTDAPFPPVHVKKERFKTVRFQKTPLLKPLSKVPVYIKVLRRRSMDDWRKHVKKNAFSNKNAIVWRGPRFTTVSLIIWNSYLYKLKMWVTVFT